jgi:glycosyltransferase involved in cell wall biosynthesis
MRRFFVMKSLPLVTVIIPTYNYEKYIVEAIESVLSSDYPQSCIEIIVVDDGSTDNTADLVQKYYGSKVKYVYIENSKKVGAVKQGLNLANGKYIFNLDADDLFEAQKIRTVVDIFERDPEIVHVSHVNQYWDVNSGHTKLEQIPPYLLGKKIDGNDALIYLYRRKLAFGAGSTYAGRSDIIKEGLVFNNDIGTIVDEYLAIATMANGYTYFIGTPLTKYRRHGENDSMSHMGIFVEYHRAVEYQVKLDPRFSNEFKALYSLKTIDLSLYVQKISQKDTSGETFNLYAHLISNLILFKLSIFVIMRHYGLLKYLIPTSIFSLIRNNIKIHL